MKQKFRLIYTFFSLALFGSLFLSYSNGNADLLTTAPGDGGTCANCHGGATSAATVALTNVPTSFVRGQTYPLTLTLSHSTATHGGFQIVATNGTSNAMIGSFSAPSGTQLTAEGRLIHNSKQSFLGTTSTSWTFDWTAPTTGAPANVVFHYVGNAVNNDGWTSGDAVITGNTSTVLPIELLNFAAKTGNNKTVNLAWATASERNNSHFVIERSADNLKFDAIAQLKGNGNATAKSDYQFADDASNVSSDVVYYRLQQVDFDGKTTYSKTISVAIESKATLKIYPNFAQRGAILQVETTKNSVIEVLNMNGQVVQNLGLSSDKTTQSISTSDLPSGRYFVRLIGSGLVKTSSFIVL